MQEPEPREQPRTTMAERESPSAMGRGLMAVSPLDKFVGLGVKVTKRLLTTFTGQAMPTLECDEDGPIPLGSPPGLDA